MRSFIILQSGEGLTVNNRANFAKIFGKKKSKMKLSGVSFIEEHAQKLLVKSPTRACSCRQI